MSTHSKLTNILIIATLMISLIPTGSRGSVQAQDHQSILHTQGAKAPVGDVQPARTPALAEEPPLPLPRYCDDVTAPGEDPPACCAYGYAYYEDEPVAGASVHVESPYGTLDTTTTSGGASSQPYYSADLSSSPLLASPGDVITITVSYSDMVSARTWTVQSEGQHVDLGLVAGYQAPGPVSALSARRALQAQVNIAPTQHATRFTPSQTISQDATASGGVPFGPGATITDTAEGARSVRAADIDADGDLDVLSASWTDDKIAWYENDGGSPPAFTSHIITTNADGTRSVYAADVDGDGDLDVLSASANDDKIAWYENDGGSPPAFTGYVITTTADFATSVYAADVDGDGNLDVLSASYFDGKIAWYENDGGSPPAFTGHVITTTADSAWSVHAADVDGDGDTDVLSASAYDDKIAWYENDGGSPPAFTGYVITTNADGAWSVYAADVDGDGDMDVLSASEHDDKIAWYENDGGSPPAFTPHIITTNADYATSVHAADVDDDGDLDILSASWYDNKIAWYENDGASSPAFTDHVITTDALGGRSVYAADMDGDGDVDVLSASDRDHKIAWYPNETIHRSATFPVQAQVVITNAADGAESVYVADVDGDGDLDVLSASLGDDKIAWYENDGSSPPAFTGHVITTNADYAVSVYAADVDGDGDVDVLSASELDDKIAWYENDGGSPPAFTGYVITTTVDHARSVYAADVDGDGDLDVLSASYDDDKIVWYENNGGSPPAFTSYVITTTADQAHSVYTADVDGDGDLDVLSASSLDHKIAWYENDGDSPPVFTGHVITTTAHTARSVYAADVDGDGDVDVLSASSGDDKIAWYENDGGSPPTFTGHAITTNADYAYSVYAADVDSDGDVDVLSASSLDDKIAWYENNGGSPPAFTGHVITTNADFARSVYAADVDGDGDLDVLSASGWDDKIVWYENRAVHAAPSADFTASSLSGNAPLDVAFTDQSTGDIIAWDWTFGDGGVSGGRHPAHEYESAGTYTVSLTVSGPGGSDTETKTNYITVNPPPGSQPPEASISFIWYPSYPNPAVQGQDTIYFNGSGSDKDEGGAYITAYVWNSSIDGQLSTQEDFTIPAAELSAGAHTIRFKVQDDEDEWSQEVIRYLTVQSGQQDVRTLILVNRQKLETLYSASEADDVMDKLNLLAAHDSVKGLVVQVENDATVAAAYAAWDADPTSTARANAVAEAIKAVVDAQWASYPDLEYLVIVGDDRVVPFRRVLDQTRHPESNYGSVSSASTTGAALRDDMTLTDDYYADAVPTIPGSPDWDGHDLYIPDLGTGRLVETPDEIVAQIDAFLADDGVTAGDAIVTAYDFLEDGAQAVCNELSGDGLTTDCTLIGESWNATQFRSNVLNTRHDVVSINGHASHYVIGTPSGSVLSSDIAGAAADHTRALFYTVGCHSGLNVPPSNPYQPLDTAQALVQHQANYVANTGYGWGYRASVGLSEQLMLDFTERLVYGQSATVGQALAAAKQEYYLNEREFDYYDEKIMIESTLYGLPMYRYTTPTATAPRLGAQGQGQGVSAIKQEQVTALGNGLTVNSLSYQFPALTAESTDDGQYYAFGDRVHTGDGEPVQPKYIADLSFPGTRAHGVVFRGGVYTDVTSFNPVVDQAITKTLTLVEPSFGAPGWYPTLPQRLNRLERGDKLVTLLGQFNPQSQMERVYDQLSFDVYYHTSSSDWTFPSIESMNSGLGAGSALISVGVEDDSGIQAVVIAYTDGDGTWYSTSLTESGGKWSGSFTASADTEFFIQVVDQAGNVIASDNNGRYFQPGDSLYTVYLPLALRNH